MKKYANSNNATCIKLNCKPGEPITMPANEPDSVKLTRLRVEAESTPYGKDFTATHTAEKPPASYKHLCSRIQGMLKSCNDRGVEFDIESAALQLNTSEDRIAEILDEVTR